MAYYIFTSSEIGKRYEEIINVSNDEIFKIGDFVSFNTNDDQMIGILMSIECNPEYTYLNDNAGTVYFSVGNIICVFPDFDNGLCIKKKIKSVKHASIQSKYFEIIYTTGGLPIAVKHNTTNKILDMSGFYNNSLINVHKVAQCHCCYETIDPGDYYITGNHNMCEHTFCSNCIEQTMKANLEKYIFSLDCIHTDGCQYLFNINKIKKCLKNQDNLKRFEDIVEINEVYNKSKKINNFQICPNCKKYGCVTNNKKKFYDCIKCKFSWCRKCRLEAHAKRECWSFDRNTKKEHVINLINEVISWHQTDKCPACNKFYQKTDGCNHMTCPCGAEFCYQCNTLYKKNFVGKYKKACWCNGTIRTHDVKREENIDKVIDKCSEIMRNNIKNGASKHNKIIKEVMIANNYVVPKNVEQTDIFDDIHYQINLFYDCVFG